MVFEPRLLPGGGATEMAVSRALTKKGQVCHAKHHNKISRDKTPPFT